MLEISRCFWKCAIIVIQQPTRYSKSEILKRFARSTCVMLSDVEYHLARTANLPEGLYILLALISSFYFFYYEQSYLSICWTNFHDLFTKWKVFAWIFWSGPVFPIPQGTLPWQPILWQNYLPSLHLSLWHSETEWEKSRIYARLNIATNATILCKILVKIGPVVSAENILIDGNCDATGLQFDDRRPFVGNY